MKELLCAILSTFNTICSPSDSIMDAFHQYIVNKGCTVRIFSVADQEDALVC